MSCFAKRARHSMITINNHGKSILIVINALIEAQSAWIKFLEEEEINLVEINLEE